jgi:hypothetical protein
VTYSVERGEMKGQSTARAICAGGAAGLAGALAMDQFTRVWNLFVPESKQRSKPRASLPYSAQEWDSTSRTASKTASVLGRSLTAEQRRCGAQIVHFTVGIFGGAAYALLFGRKPGVLSGLAFGSALWLIGEELAMPALGINDPPQHYTLADHANSLGEHIAYGIVTGALCDAASN